MSRIGPANTRGASRLPTCCGRRSVLTLSVRVCPIRTDPWNVDNDSGDDHS